MEERKLTTEKVSNDIRLFRLVKLAHNDNITKVYLSIHGSVVGSALKAMENP